MKTYRIYRALNPPIQGGKFKDVKTEKSAMAFVKRKNETARVKDWSYAIPRKK